MVNAATPSTAVPPTEGLSAMTIAPPLSDIAILSPVFPILLDYIHHLVPTKCLYLSKTHYERAVPAVYSRVTLCDALFRGLKSPVPEAQERTLKALALVRTLHVPSHESINVLSLLGDGLGGYPRAHRKVLSGVECIEMGWGVMGRPYVERRAEHLRDSLRAQCPKTYKQATYFMENPGDDEDKRVDRSYQLSVALSEMRPKVATIVLAVDKKALERGKGKVWGYLDDLQYHWSGGKVLRIVLDVDTHAPTTGGLFKKSAASIYSLITTTPSVPSSSTTDSTTLVVKHVRQHYSAVFMNYCVCVSGAESDRQWAEMRGQTPAKVPETKVAMIEYHVKEAKEVEERVRKIVGRKESDYGREFFEKWFRFVELDRAALGI
ncbi:hypothetical protein IAT38_002187 [Cryptococcus sp. DSM 104549]